MNLSKSRYTKGVQCPKMLWMDAHMPEQFDESVMNEAVLRTGSEVGDLAMGYYGDFVEIPFDHLNFNGMVRLTQELLESKTPVICEATFATEGCLCMVDILRVEPDGVHIVEVKSSTKISDIYYHDMAFQTWVLKRCGLDVKSVSLMHLNNQYARQGDIDLHQLFTVEDHTSEVFAMLDDVDKTIPSLQLIVESSEEPVKDIGCHCKNPYDCGYRKWCWRDLPKPSVFDLSRMQMKKALELRQNGILSLKDVASAGVKLSTRQQVQIECECADLSDIVDTVAVRKFLDGLAFPLYFLDFETFQPAIPPFEGVRPYQQIPTQYSLHVLREPDGELEHYEFLAEAGADPRRAVAESLVSNIPMGVCTLAYNMGFEKGRIKELAEAFPDLAEHLLAINEGMDDLIKPFNAGSYYARAMGGSNSIKYVLPALFPNDPELDYHSLEGVHNGSEAMTIYAELEGMAPEDAARARENLLRYCELDTYAMVKIYLKLVQAAER